MDRDFHGRTAIGARYRGLLLEAALDRSHVLQPHLDVAHGTDHDARHLVQVREPGQDADNVLGRAILDAAGGQIDILALQAGRDLGQGNPHRSGARLIDVNLDLFLHPARHQSGGGAVDALQPLLDGLIGEHPQPRLLRQPHRTGALGADTDPHDRVEGGIEAQQDRLLRRPGERELGELLTHVDRGEVHVGTPGELHDHV